MGKVLDGYKRATEKRVEETKSGAGSWKLAICRHFILLSFLHSTVTSQGTDSDIDIVFCENQNDIESSNKIREDSQITTNSRNTSGMSNATETCQAKNKSTRKSEDTIDAQLRESLNNVNDAVKVITQNLNFVNESHNNSDSDMLFCRGSVDFLRGQLQGKTASMKMKEVLSK